MRSSSLVQRRYPSSAQVDFASAKVTAPLSDKHVPVVLLRSHLGCPAPPVQHCTKLYTIQVQVVYVVYVSGKTGKEEGGGRRKTIVSDREACALR